MHQEHLAPVPQGYALTLHPAVLALIGIDPLRPVTVTTDGRRLIISQDQASTVADKQMPILTDTLPTSDMSCLDATYKYLQECGTGKRPEDIAQEIIRRGWWTTKGKTPDNTVSAQITTEIKREGDKARFVRVAKNTFAARQ